MCLLVREREREGGKEGRRERTVSPATPTNSLQAAGDFAATSNIAHFKFSPQYVAHAAQQDLQFPYASPKRELPGPVCAPLRSCQTQRRRPLDSTVALRSAAAT